MKSKVVDSGRSASLLTSQASTSSPSPLLSTTVPLNISTMPVFSLAPPTPVLNGFGSSKRTVQDEEMEDEEEEEEDEEDEEEEEEEEGSEEQNSEASDDDKSEEEDEGLRLARLKEEGEKDSEDEEKEEEEKNNNMKKRSFEEDQEVTVSSKRSKSPSSSSVSLREILGGEKEELKEITSSLSPSFIFAQPTTVLDKTPNGVKTASVSYTFTIPSPVSKALPPQIPHLPTSLSFLMPEITRTPQTLRTRDPTRGPGLPDVASSVGGGGFVPVKELKLGSVMDILGK